VNYHAIPQELRERAQWVCWRYEDRGGTKPTKVPYSPWRGTAAAVDNPETWCGFDQAVSALATGAFAGIGFVLTAEDPYAFIDLDDVHGDEVALERQKRIYNAFSSYSEISPSGNGLHIIVRGAVPEGRKRAGIEVYSSLRYMTMTGNVYNNAPIEDRQALLTLLHEEMRGQVSVQYYDGSDPPTESDQDIMNRAWNAANGEKFQALWQGRWADYYPSQSEADFALIDMLAFYTNSAEQIVRMFKCSALATREKAQRTRYIKYMLDKAFDRKLPPVNLDAIVNSMKFQIATMPETMPTRIATVDPAIPTPIAQYRYLPPPGLVGEIAQFVYDFAPRQVPEIALGAAIGLMSGICGRAYNVSRAGLNLYTIVLAKTGVGKEAAADGIDTLMSAVQQHVPAARDFIGPGEIQSAEALLKHLSLGSASFVSILGEVGIKLQQMTAWNASPTAIALRRVMLDLFNKSGEDRVLHEMVYSDRSKNTHALNAPAFSFLGESTPERFYEGLTENMVTEGLVPRLLIIEYLGDRPDLNKNRRMEPPPELVQKLAALCGNALMLNQADKALHVGATPEAEQMLDAFERQATDTIRGSNSISRELWNRAHFKVLKLSALLAVGNHPFAPVVDVPAVEWAIRVVVDDIQNLMHRFEVGSVGIATSGDEKQITDTMRAIRDYLTKPLDMLGAYDLNANMHAQHVIPYSYLSRRLVPMTSFKMDRRGGTTALKAVVAALVDRGDIQELPRSQAAANFQTLGKCYAVTNLQTFFRMQG
jgi:hypothetical protein